MLSFERVRSAAALAAAAVVALVPSASLSASTEDQTVPVTDRVSVAPGGIDPTGPSFDPSISADARYVAFWSAASNLVPGDTNGWSDVFVYDRESDRTERVSTATEGTQGNGNSFNPAISADGRYVAFFSYATSLVPGDTNGLIDVFVHDRQTGTTERVSVASDGTQGNNPSTDPSISADGRYVAFATMASNLVAGDTNGASDIFVRDRQVGTTQRVSLATDGTQGNSHSQHPSISGDGRYVAFFSYADNLVPGDTNGAVDVFVHDLQTGVTTRESVASDGSRGNGNSFVVSPASFSADDRRLVFLSLASNLVPGDTNQSLDAFVHDLKTGATERVSVASDGTEGNKHSWFPSISADGRYVAFYSSASTLVPGDTNGFIDAFVHDLQTGATERVSVASDGAQANGDSWASALIAVISGDGRYVAFNSDASNLVPEDKDGFYDVFVRDRGGPLPAASRGRYPLVPGDPYLAAQWGLVKVRAPQAWQALQATGFKVKVAVIDSGVDLQHRDLRCAGKLGPGASVLGGVVNPGYGADDVTGHGSLVAGIIGACTNNATGIAGVAPDATILPYRVVPATGPGSLADVAQAIRLATDAGAQVINLSFGPVMSALGSRLLDDLGAAIDNAAAAGVVVVAAAGGDAMGLCDYPALAQHLLCVGATDNNDASATYSPLVGVGGPAVVAPGGSELVACDHDADSILSLYPREFDNCNEGRFGYRDASGTALAAAHVSGVAALVYDHLGGARTPANAAKVIDVIVSSAKDLGRPGTDPTFGSGRVDALAAIVKAGPPPSTLSFIDHSASSGQYTDPTHLEARLQDSDGAPIAGRQLSFELAGAGSTRTFSAITDAGGVAAVGPTLSEQPGAYLLTVRYPGNEYQAAAAAARFLVDKEDTTLALTVQGKGKQRTLTARLSDQDTPTNGIAQRTIDFTADGKPIGSGITSSDGVATFKPPPKYQNGKHTFTARFAGDDFYRASSASIST